MTPSSPVRLTFFAAVLCLVAGTAAAQTLAVERPHPHGEVTDLEQAREVRVTFSEPMIPVGAREVAAGPGWFRIRPALPGKFRWVGTSTLVFEADRGALRNATRYEVVIGAEARALSGRQLPQPYRFSFTTPTLRVMDTRWYRTEGADGAIVLALRFNQAVDGEALLPHISVRATAQEQVAPRPEEQRRLKASAPAAARALEQKLAAARSIGPRRVMVFLPESWDAERLGETPDDRLLVIQTQPGVPAGSQLEVQLSAAIPAPAGSAVPGFVQTSTTQLEPVFFVAGLDCYVRCNPEHRNAITFSVPVEIAEFRRSLTVTDVTDPTGPVVLKPGEMRDANDWYDPASLALEDAGYSVPPGRTIRLQLDPAMKSASGQTLGYPWVAGIEYLHRPAYASFGDGHGVWETSGGTTVPFWARNLRTVKQWLAPISREELVPLIVANQKQGFRSAPAGTPTTRNLKPTPDKVQSFGFDFAAATGGAPRGLLLAAIEEGTTIPRAALHGERMPRSTIIQATDLGLTVKDGPAGSIVFVSRLSNAQPVDGAMIEIRNMENRVLWSGRSGADGVARIPAMPLRENWWDAEFVVIATLGPDTAYLVSNWYEGLQPWSFNLHYDIEQAEPTLRGTVFSDRGIYRPGETVRLKAIVRSDRPDGMTMIPRNARVHVQIRDARSQVIDERDLALGAWSSTDWEITLPGTAPLGDASITATVDGERGELYGSFFIGAYRRPDFRVDVTTAAAEPLAGSRISSVVAARYLSGAAMPSREVRWSWTARPASVAPEALTERWEGRRLVWLGWCDDDADRSARELERKSGRLSSEGRVDPSLVTERVSSGPVVYTLEAEVTDRTRQRIASRSSVYVHPAEFYLGVQAPESFVRQGSRVESAVLAAAPDGEPRPGQEVTVELIHVQWNSVRRAEGNGFYTWESERRETVVSTQTLRTAAEPVPFTFVADRAGTWMIRASARDTAGRTAMTCASLWVVGGGYAAWQRHDHNRIDLTPERAVWSPGQTAKLVLSSPWEEATALVTTEREGVRSYRVMPVSSTQPEFEIPITEDDAPNIFVSVVLVKGRSSEALDASGGDPGRPSFRVGYAKLRVRTDAKRLRVDVTPRKEEYRPGEKALIGVSVTDHSGAPVVGEVTLWAVDAGVLALTGYETPDPLDEIWAEKALSVMTTDSRQRVISRRVLTPKGTTEGGGGGAALGSEAMRRDFRPLAFWLGSVTTNARGRANLSATLPDSLTAYRVMAVAADAQSRFGSGEAELRTSKPVQIRPALPRFLTVGDEASFGGLLLNATNGDNHAIVTIRSLDDSLEIGGQAQRLAEVARGQAVEVPFALVARRAGVARLEMTAKIGDESDSFRIDIPIQDPRAPRVAATAGVTEESTETLFALPEPALLDRGGMRIELASTALAGLRESARYLITYPYGCAEQRASATLALALANELGEILGVDELAPGDARGAVQESISGMARYQCDSGGFAFWAGDCASASPYLSAWVVSVLLDTRELGYSVDQSLLDRALDYLDNELGHPRRTMPQSEQTVDWQAAVVRELARSGRDVSARIEALWPHLDRMPVFALADLLDAALASGADEERVSELRRRVNNSLVVEATVAHARELDDDRLEWFWSSTERTTAMVIGSLTRAGAPREDIAKMVRWLLDARVNGRWGNTQENARALRALVSWRSQFEATTPSFSVEAFAGAAPVVSGTFEGRSDTVAAGDASMEAIAPDGVGRFPVRIEKKGEGTLHWLARLTWVPASPRVAADSQGFTVERSYTRIDDEGNPLGSVAQGVTAGSLVRVTLRIDIPAERRFVAVVDPLPAGFEAIDPRLATTAETLEPDAEQEPGWLERWTRGGFDHVERYDDRLHLFATRLGPGVHEYTYLVRATTRGAFLAPAPRAEEMYHPEVRGHGSTSEVTVK